MQTIDRQQLIERTFRKMQAPVLAIFRQAALCEADCEDLAQNVFLRLMSIDLLLPETIEGITATIAYHLRTDYLRRRAFLRSRYRDNVTADVFDDRRADDHALLLDIYNLEQRALERMQPVNRQIYLLSHYSGQTNDEIAVTLSMSNRAVESRLYRSRQEVRDYIRRMAL